MSLLAGLDEPTDGRLHVAGYDLRNLSETRKNTYRRTVLGIIFQAFNLIGDLTVYENVELPLVYAGMLRNERRERAREALEAVGVSERGRPVGSS